jgi:hypothetical protein
MRQRTSLLWEEWGAAEEGEPDPDLSARDQAPCASYRS